MFVRVLSVDGRLALRPVDFPIRVGVLGHAERGRREVELRAVEPVESHSAELVGRAAQHAHAAAIAHAVSNHMSFRGLTMVLLVRAS